MKRNISGITLITLVITIIVLLILAAVSIATLTGENGILTRANEARTETEESKEDELRRLTALEAATNTENTTHTDDSTGNEKTVTIPAGFAVSQVEGENTIADGLVIIDSKGNEFVWVPVDGVAESDADAEENQQLYAKHEYSSKYDDASTNVAQSDGWVTWQYFGTNASYLTKDDSINTESVNKYNGFYIGRYEAGIREVNEGTYTSGILTGTNSWSSYNNNTNIGKPVSKFGYSVWNMISQTNAIIVANNMYSDSESVVSQLVDSYAWDTTCNWIAMTNSQDINDKNNRCITNSTSWGNYYNNSFSVSKGLYAEHSYTEEGYTMFGNWNLVNSKYTKEINTRVEMLTGMSGFKANNIYDFAGNIYEWTTELVSRDGSNYTAPVLRGGSFANTGNNLNACNRRAIQSMTGADIAYGFRVVLYLK